MQKLSADVVILQPMPFGATIKILQASGISWSAVPIIWYQKASEVEAILFTMNISKGVIEESKDGQESCAKDSSQL